MHRVQITAARYGAQKVSHTKLIQSAAGLGLAAAKQITDDVLDQKSPSVAVPSGDAARKLVEDLDEIGFTAHMVE
jgi:ribosomal protein L7/L12